MRKRTAAAASAALIAIAGLSYAEAADFSSVPANIADAPVDRWIGVERADRHQVYRWTLRIPDGIVVVSQLWRGVYYPEARYSSEENVLRMFQREGLDNFRRVESTASHGSRWGYIAMGKHGTADCLAGIVMGRNDFHHDGEDGGNLEGFALDCGRNAESRYGDWKTWLRSFKQVPEGYNAKLD